MQDMTYEQEALSTAEAMLRLLNNADFNKIFVKDFMNESIVQLGYNFAAQPNLRAELAEQIISRNHLKNYIDGIVSAGSQAKDVIEIQQSKMLEETE